MVYEGKVWALRALGRHGEAPAADTAMSLDPAAVVPNTTNGIYSALAVGDTATVGMAPRTIVDADPACRRQQ